MSKNLFESYKNRLAVCEAIHQKSHMGAKMSTAKKLMVVQVLDNTARFLNESLSTGAATQGIATNGGNNVLGDYKKFCLNIATVALPNLILPELMIVRPMTSFTGYISYIKYSAGVEKGGVKQYDLFNGPWSHGVANDYRANYTSAAVVEPIAAEAGECVLSWEPVEGTVYGIKKTGERESLSPVEGKVTFDPGTYEKVTYFYNNINIPQTGDEKQSRVPTLVAGMDGISLEAKARRIAIYYSQIAAFQAKTDYGMDLAEQLSTQAQGELAYEIDTEGVLMLDKGAEPDDALVLTSYEKKVGAGTGVYIGRAQYYEIISEYVARARQIMFTRTQKFAPNYMVVGSNVLTILPYAKGWVAAPASTVNGPFFAGTLDGIKVFCSPAIDPNRFFFGVNGDDLQSSAGIYAPYMAIVPTQLLGLADGGMSQGFSTLYDMKLLSTYEKDGKTYSYLLVAGKLDV